MWNYLGQPVKTISDWWYQQNDNAQTLDPVQRMRKLLKACKYQSSHITDLKILHQKMLMNFAQLRQQFPESNFDAMVDRPFQVSQQQKNISISIIGDIKITDAKSFIKLKLTIWFHPDNSMQNGPIFFIRNPDGTKNRPSLKFRNLYEWVLGGVKVLSFPQKIQWSTFKNDSLKRAVKGIIQQAQTCFPFVRIKQTQNKQTIQVQSLLQKVKEIKLQYQKISLQDIQNLAVISQVLNSQLKIIKQQKAKAQIVINLDQQANHQDSIHQNIDYLNFVVPADENSQYMLSLLSEQRALSDCQVFLQSKLKNQHKQDEQRGNSSSEHNFQQKILFSQFLQQIKIISERKFQTRVKIIQQCEKIHKQVYRK